MGDSDASTSSLSMSFEAGIWLGQYICYSYGWKEGVLQLLGFGRHKCQSSRMDIHLGQHVYGAGIHQILEA